VPKLRKNRLREERIHNEVIVDAYTIRFADQLNHFARHMAEEQGHSPYSVRSHCAKASKFLEWFGERHRLLTRARIEDVDEFLATIAERKAGSEKRGRQEHRKRM
jgi:site-specific recombinase XerD